MSAKPTMTARERLMFHVQELERLERLRERAMECLREGFEAAAQAGYDRSTLKVVLKLRKLTPDQRRERRALEAIYMAALGMLEGDALPDEARKRLDEDQGERRPTHAPSREPGKTARRSPEPEAEQKQPDPPPPAQAPLILKDPDEARQEGADAATAGKRIYDNPYPAGDHCRAAWDEGWCAQNKSHGMETPAAFQRRSAPKPPDKPDKRDKDGDGAGESERGAA